MSYLTQSASSLQTQVIAALESETGLTFNRLTETVAKFYARCLGDSTAYLRKSDAQMLAELNTQFDGSAVSHLRMGYAQLLDTLDATLAGSGGGGEELPEAPEGFGYVVNKDGDYVVNKDEAYVIAVKE